MSWHARMRVKVCICFTHTHRHRHLSFLTNVYFVQGAVEPITVRYADSQEDKVSNGAKKHLTLAENDAHTKNPLEKLC